MSLRKYVIKLIEVIDLDKSLQVYKCTMMYPVISDNDTKLIHVHDCMLSKLENKYLVDTVISIL